MKDNSLIIGLLAIVAIVLVVALIRHMRSQELAYDMIPSLLKNVWRRGRDIRQDLAKEDIFISARSLHSIMTVLVKEKACLARQSIVISNREEVTMLEYRLPFTESEREAQEKESAAREKDCHDNFEKNVAAFREQLPALLLLYPDQYVAIVDGEVVEHMIDNVKLWESVEKRFPLKFPVVCQVTPMVDETAEIPTMETV